MTEHTVRWHAPGRVNLIGEHTDYNAGLALPFALEQGCAATVSIAERFTAASAQTGEELTVDDLSDLPEGWVRYVLGPARVLRDRGVDVPPVSVHVDSDVPVGAGLSSSAAVVCSVTAALDDLLGLELSSDELVTVARAAENDVVGAPTGGLDHMASLRCREGSALLIDFDGLSAAHVPLDPSTYGLELLVVDTGVGHGHADGAYAERRRACEEAARELGVDSLREIASPAELAALSSDVLRRRARHVLAENARVQAAVELLRGGHVDEIGPLLSDSHASLRDDFEVSTPELDLAVEALLGARALGARMTGGGFGGSVIALLEGRRVDFALRRVRDAFAEAGYAEPHGFTVRPSAGAERRP